MKRSAHPQVLLMLLPSLLSTFYLYKSLGTRSKRYHCRKEGDTTKDHNMKLYVPKSLPARRWKGKGNYLHSPLAIEHLTQASKLLSWEFFHSYWRERSIQEGFTLKSWRKAGKIYFFAYYSGKNLLKPGVMDQCRDWHKIIA